MTTKTFPDKTLLRRRFARRNTRRHNDSGDSARTPLTQIPAERLFARLADMRLTPATVVDAGGNGDWMRQCYPQAHVIAADWIPQHSAHSTICCDVEQLPLADASIDIVWSNFCYEWVDEAQLTAEVARILKPNGLFAFTRLGASALQEIRASCRTHSRGDTMRAHNFPDMHNVGDDLLHRGFAEPLLESDTFTLTYATAADCIAELHANAAGLLFPEQARGLTGKQQWQQWLTAYAQHATTTDNKIAATYEVIYATAWRREAQQTNTLGESPIQFHP